MFTYVKIFLFQYILINFCVSFLFLFTFTDIIFFWPVFMLFVSSIYYYYKMKKETLTKAHVYTNIVISMVSIIALVICLWVSRGYISSPVWNLFFAVTFPFAPIYIYALFFGDFFSKFFIIIGILLYNTVISYLIIKNQFHTKRMIPIASLCICLMIINVYLYRTSDPIQYKGGHQFEYMYGYSSTDLTDYTPYAQNSKLVTLNEPSTFTIDDENEMPYLDGAEACYPVYSAIAKAVYKDIDKIELNYKKDYDYLNGRIVSFTNTSVGYSRLLNRKVDMFFGAKPSAFQLEEAKQLGIKLEYTPIGQEAFVFFVNQKNPVSNLTTQQIKDIYHGDIHNWNKLGGSNHDIIAFQRPERSGSQAMMNYFMGDTSLKEPLKYEMVSGMGGIIEEVAEYKNEEGAIGYTFKYFLEGLNQEDNVKILSIDGIYPTAENIKNQTYPLSTYLYCVTLKSNQKENVKKLKEYLLSPQGQYIIEQTGYYALN